MQVSNLVWVFRVEIVFFSASSFCYFVENSIDDFRIFNLIQSHFELLSDNSLPSSIQDGSLFLIIFIKSSFVKSDVFNFQKLGPLMLPFISSNSKIIAV